MKLLQVLPAAILWAVVATRLVGLRFGWQLGILPAVFLVAMGATLNIDLVYLVVDNELGDRNLLNLIVHLFLGLGMTDLSRLLLQATKRSSTHIKMLMALGGALALVQVGLLVVSDTQGSATNFTDTFGASPTVALYQASFFAWVGIITGYTGIECLRRNKCGESSLFRTGFDIVSVACLTGVMAVAVKMGLIGVEIVGFESEYEHPFYLGYRSLVALTIVGFAVGFSLPSYGLIRANLMDRRKRERDMDLLRPIVRRLMGTAEGQRSMEAAKISLDARNSKTQLYRWIILIGDCRVLDPDLISPEESEIVDDIGEEIEHAGSTEDAMVLAGV